MENNNFYTFSEYMKDNNLTISEEDYLEMIYRHCLNANFTRVNELAQSLNVKPPSVSSMIKRLVDKKLIKHVEYGMIELTKEGEKLGMSLLDRHNTVEQFLKLINVKHDALEETEKIEHTLSPNTLINIKLLVEFFKKNPEIYDEYYDWINKNSQ